MKIVNFTVAHVERAAQIAKQNYEEERGYVPALPSSADLSSAFPTLENMPDLTPFADNGLSVAAIDGGDVVGFLCSYGVWNDAWDIPGLRHVFSPMHANGTIPENRAKIYARLYQAAGEKWARVGAASHGICLYAHDREAQEQFFRYGFGMRCIDAIRGMDDVASPNCGGYEFTELVPERYSEVYPLNIMLQSHYCKSPFFMVRPNITEAEFLENENGDRYFVARKDGATVAFLCFGRSGETFLRKIPGYIHADGAYCLPEHRGKGLLQNLLNLATSTFKNEGYKYLGVDFESINPPAYGFWLKHFTAYTHSVVRRIDENAVAKK